MACIASPQYETHEAPGPAEPTSAEPPPIDVPPVDAPGAPADPGTAGTPATTGDSTVAGTGDPEPPAMPSRSPGLMLTLLLFGACLIGVAALAVMAARPPTGTGPGSEAARTMIEVLTFPIESTAHTQGRFIYAQNPPAGGPHTGEVQNCGFYTEPAVTEQAVHSLEHGAIWITYRPELPAEQLAILRDLAGNRTHVLVSPWPRDLPAPIVATAWGRQLWLETADDPKLVEFVRHFRANPEAPEPSGACPDKRGSP